MEDHCINISDVLRTAVICYSSEEEAETSDVIENTPTNSPIYFREITDGFKRREQCNKVPFSPKPKPKLKQLSSPNYLQQGYDIGEQSIVAPPFSPLTPETKLTELTGQNCLREGYDIGEQSIEAPPFSPLTPRPNSTNTFGKKSLDTNDFVHEVGKRNCDPTRLSLQKRRVKTKKKSLVKDNEFSEQIKKPSTSQTSRTNLKRKRSNVAAGSGFCQNANAEIIPSSPLLVLCEDKPLINYSRQKSNKNKRQIEIETSPCHSMTSELLEHIDIVDLEDHDFVNNSDDSVNDPNYVEEDYNDSDSTCCEDNDQETINRTISKKNKSSFVNCEDSSNENQHVQTLKQIALKKINCLLNDYGAGRLEIQDNSERREYCTEYNDLQNNVSNMQLVQSVGYNSDDETDERKGRPKKGRMRKHYNTKSEIKQLKYKNLPYFNRKNQLIEPKTFDDYKCSCKKKCGDILSSEAREREFNKFVHTGSYTAQTLFIIGHVQETKKKRTLVIQNNPKKAKEFSRIYKLAGVNVCKDMFMNTLKISPQRITICLQKNRTGEIIKDNRGDRGGFNKVDEKEINFAKSVIERVPKYISHYRRNATDSKFLAPGTTLVNLYERYKRDFDLLPDKQDRKQLSFSKFKNIFYENFNLKIKTLKKDTCNKCDKYAIEKESSRNLSEKQIATEKHDKHLKLAEISRQTMKDDFEKAKTDKTMECITFDLEKTLPLPRIPTNVVFYKRQLWVYNSGIHVASNDCGYCYIWVEGEASRGAQEVGSCLMMHLKTELRPEVEHLVTWSDSCGGQNRNIKITLMLKAILHSHPTLKTIRLRYLEPGHSFLPNDTDFSKIETQLKHHERLYTVEDYIQVMRNCRKKKPLRVVRMKSETFWGTENLEKNIQNRKVCVAKGKINWLKTKEILLKKEDTHLIYMRKNFEEDYQILNIKKRGKAAALLGIKEEDLIPLWPQGKEIPQVKLDDIRSMYEFIPADARPFYENLKGNCQIDDDVDGFCGTPDFQLFYSDEE